MNQSQAIVDHCNKYGSITSRIAVDMLGILSLHRRMSDMRENGYDFSATWEDVPSRYGNRKARVLRYRITKKPKRKAK